MNDDIIIQVLTLAAIILGIVLPLIFKTHLKTLFTVALLSLILGFILFTLLVIVQSGIALALYIFYMSMFLWMFGLILMIQTSIQRKRRLK